MKSISCSGVPVMLKSPAQRQSSTPGSGSQRAVQIATIISRLFRNNAVIAIPQAQGSLDFRCVKLATQLSVLEFDYVGSSLTTYLPHLVALYVCYPTVFRASRVTEAERISNSNELFPKYRAQVRCAVLSKHIAYLPSSNHMMIIPITQYFWYLLCQSLYRLDDLNGLLISCSRFEQSRPRICRKNCGNADDAVDRDY